MNCRHCQTPLYRKFLDLGYAPPSNAYLTESDLMKPEQTFPLRLYVCEKCFLVQTEDYSRCEDLFSNEYAYFSSVSTFLLDHARKYCNMITNRLQLNSNSYIMEIASNDGYLLKNFVKNKIPCIGIEPTTSTAEVAETFGIPIIKDFFTEKFARQFVKNHLRADLVIGNNVYAHVPDINDFTAGLKIILKPGGTITLEFQHVLNMVNKNQFDTVYHEHYSYLSLRVVDRIFEKFGLKVYDVEKINPHGGSLRVYGCHANEKVTISNNVEKVLKEEDSAGMNTMDFYLSLQPKANKVKYDLLAFLIEQHRLGKKVIAYGAAAKANTLFNYVGIKPDLIPFICDAAKSKQGKFLPGSHIPIVGIDALFQYKPDYILIIPWNIKEEIMQCIASANLWGAKFLITMPNLHILEYHCSEMEVA